MKNQRLILSLNLLQISSRCKEIKQKRRRIIYNALKFLNGLSFPFFNRCFSDKLNLAVEISDVERRWITRALERDYCLTRIVPYKERALTFGVDFANVDSSKIIAPECSFYRFLNNLDYSTDMLNDFPLGLRRHTRLLLITAI